MTVDGAKFNYNFKSIPANYWQYNNSGKKKEAEERILTNRPYIENALSYIKHVDFYIPTAESANDYMRFSSKEISQLFEIVDILKNKNIPHYLYTSRSDFELARNARPLDMEFIAKYTDEHGFRSVQDNSREWVSIEKFRAEAYYYVLKNVLFGTDENKIKELETDKQFGEEVVNIRNMTKRTFIKSIESFVYSCRMVKELREDIHKILMLLKRCGVNNFKELYKRLVPEDFQM